MDSKIRLCKNIRMDKDYKHVLSYTESEMLSLCESSNHLVASANNYSFIRKTGQIIVEFSYGTCIQCNYMAFQNPTYNNKWFFAFIDDVIFNSTNSCEIKYTVDVWSTWFSYWEKSPCFVVREHVTDDSIGANTIDENLDVGRVFASKPGEEEILKGSNWIGVMSSWNPAKTVNKQFDGISVYAGTVFGKEIFLFNVEEGYANLINFIRKCNEDGHIEDITDIFIVTNTIALSSDLIYNIFEYPKDSGETYQFATMYASRESYGYDKSISKNYSWTSYTPRNNKCYCYPYNYLLISNNVGNYNIYKWEDFADNEAKFRIEETCAIGGDCRIVPLNYQGQSKNIDESIPLGKLPVCGWSADSFTNWLTENAINIGSRIITDVVLGFAVPEAGASVASDVISLIGQFRSASMAPNIERSGSNNGNVNLTSKDNTFVYKSMRCRNEYMQVIDDFFTMYRI